NSAAASSQSNSIFASSNTPSNVCSRVSASSLRCAISNVKSAQTPWCWRCDHPYTIGIIAARIVHWLMLLDTMFINAMGACVTRRVAHEDPQISHVQRDEHDRIDHADALPPDDHKEVEQRRDQPHDFHGVLGLERDGRQSFLPPPATGNREDEIDHRPAEAEEQTNRTGQIGDGEMRALGIASGFPRDDGFNGEFGK